MQIVGSTLSDDSSQSTVINFESELLAADYARIYKEDSLEGGHVISLGLGNRETALSALRAFPGGLQMGGRVNPDNAVDYLNAGASHVIVTSYVFRNGEFDLERLAKIVSVVGKERLVLDLSCRRQNDDFFIVTDRWQKFTDKSINEETLNMLSLSCNEFLVHGVDVEGKRAGIDDELVQLLGNYSPLPVTYAGGATSLQDLDRVKKLGMGRVDLTIGSALDLFGGDIQYSDVVAWQRLQNE